MKKKNTRTRIGRALARAVLPLVLGLAAGFGHAGPARDRLTLLVPDDADVNGWQVKAWVDAAADEGVRLDLITDSALLAMGTGASSKIAGLVVPDSAHIRASAQVVAAIKQYAYGGGQLMLVYDAGAQDENGFFPLSGPSRFSDLVGVDYVLWNNGAGAATMVGFGQVVGTKARLESLNLPPGKYQPYVPPDSLSMPTTTTAFVPTSQADPGGAQQMQPMVLDRMRKGIEDGSASVRRLRPVPLRDLLGLGIESGAQLRYGQRWLNATPAVQQHLWDSIVRPNGSVAAVLNADGKTYREISPSEAAVNDATLQAISGYAYGTLGYFSYVTQGSFPGTVYLSSPEHGLVAGKRAYGSGQVLFVNIPLGYFKAIGTDSAPLHGFISLFARDQLGLATMSAQPYGKGGLIFNWHVDDGDDLNTDVKNLLANTKILERGPFSIHFTAGPDVIVPGDGKGMNLPGNASSRDLVQRLGNIGPTYGSIFNLNKLPPHELGSHGGWIHDYWGLLANEENSPDLTYLLQQNFDAIQSTTGRAIREYSSPGGNTPVWAIRWLEQRGVVGSYLVADLGLGMLRSYRNGARLSNKLWTVPVSALGKYATFEEFDAFGVSRQMSGQWLLDLQSFVVNKRSNRMFYAHPPGVQSGLDPVTVVTTRADNLKLQGRYQWYTMAQLADFSQRRVETKWTTSRSGDRLSFSASHAKSLEGMTWVLPKSKFGLPLITWGLGWVTGDDINWIVYASAGNSFNFTAPER